jgi:hypothetical protein
LADPLAKTPRLSRAGKIFRTCLKSEFSTEWAPSDRPPIPHFHHASDLGLIHECGVFLCLDVGYHICGTALLWLSFAGTNTGPKTCLTESPLPSMVAK